MIKRILLVTLVSSVLILSFSSCSSKPSKSSELPKVSHRVQSQTVYDKSMSSSKKLTTSFKISPTNKSFPDDYAGSYIDSKGLLHVNLVSNKNLETYKSIVNNDSVIFSLKKTSLNTLHNIHVLLEDYMTKYKMTAIATMEQTDTVDIRLKDINNEAAILTIVTKAGYNPDTPTPQGVGFLDTLTSQILSSIKDLINYTYKNSLISLKLLLPITLMNELTIVKAHIKTFYLLLNTHTAY